MKTFKNISSICLILIVLMPAIYCSKAENGNSNEQKANVSISAVEDICKGYFFTGTSDELLYYLTKKSVNSYNLITGEIRVIAELESYISNFYFTGHGESLYYTFGGTYLYAVNLVTGETTKLFEIPNNVIKSIAVDRRGRFYFNDKKHIYVYSETGELIAEAESDSEIYYISAIDDRNGNIYYQASGEWKKNKTSSNYTNMDCLKIARLKDDNTIEFVEQEKPITYLCSRSSVFPELHYNSVEILGNKYIAALSTYGNELCILDSGAMSLDKVVENTLTMQEYNDGFDLPVNMNGGAGVLGVKHAKSSQYVGNGIRIIDEAASGSLATYISIDNQDYIVYASDEQRLSIIHAETGRDVGSVGVSNPIYRLLTVGDEIIIVEKKEDSFCVERMSVSLPGALSIMGEDSLTVGSAIQFECVTDIDMRPYVKYTSSDISVLEVDDTGYAIAKKSGTVTITADCDGIKAQKQVMVLSEETDRTITLVDGKASNNINQNDYKTYYGHTVKSYLTEIDSDTVMRVEAVEDEKDIVVEYWNRSGKLISSKRIVRELDGFGGFFAGKEYYFIVTCQENPDESDEVEVFRITRYDKNWNRNGSASIYGGYTKSPVHAGSLRMAEYNGILYMHTCHLLYKATDGKTNHQANMTYEINQSDMSIIYEGNDQQDPEKKGTVIKANITMVSHSFNQFIKVADGRVYTLDQGDANPRGVAMRDYPISHKQNTPVIWRVAHSFPAYESQHYNFTNANIGGLEITSTHAVAAYTEIISEGEKDKNNVFIATMDRKNHSTAVRQITSYELDDDKYCGNPFLVKLNNRQLFLMWSETDSINSNGNNRECAMIKLDSEGKPVGEIVRKKWDLSDCQPIRLSDGRVAWYVSETKGRINKTSEIKLYVIDPFDLGGIESIELNNDTLTLKQHDTYMLEAALHPEKAESIELAWTSSDENVVKVDTNGVVSAVGVGTATITVASAEGDLAFARCQVTVEPVKVADIVVDSTELSINIKETGKLMWSVLPGNATNTKVYFESKNPNVVSINSTGTYKALSQGETDIVISAADESGVSKTVHVLVKPDKPVLRYRAYVQKKGWMSWSKAPVGQNTNQANYAGTTDNLRMETIQMQLSGTGGYVRYRAYCAKKGWTQWATTADTRTYAGTKGESRRVEMIQLQAKGQVAELYDMYYRTYCENFGWLGWADNNAKSGSAGYARKLEAFQIRFVPKGTYFDKGERKAFYDKSKDGADPK